MQITTVDILAELRAGETKTLLKVRKGARADLFVNIQDETGTIKIETENAVLYATGNPKQFNFKLGPNSLLSVSATAGSRADISIIGVIETFDEKEALNFS